MQVKAATILAGLAFMAPAAVFAMDTSTGMVPTAEFATTTAFTVQFSLGDKVIVGDGPLRERATPSASGNILGKQQAGAVGRLADGAAMQDGHVWWFVDFDSGADGWCAEEFLKPVPIASSNAAQVAALQVALQALLEKIHALQAQQQ